MGVKHTIYLVTLIQAPSLTTEGDLCCESYPMAFTTVEERDAWTLQYMQDVWAENLSGTAPTTYSDEARLDFERRTHDFMTFEQCDLVFEVSQ